MGDSHRYANFLGHDDRALLTARQMRVRQFTPGEIAAVGRNAYRVRSGAYVFDPPENESQLHQLRAGAVVGDHHTQVAASHATAALLHGFAVPQESLEVVHITGVQHRVPMKHEPVLAGGFVCPTCASVSGGAVPDHRLASSGSGQTATALRGGIRNGVHTHVTPLPCRQIEYVDGFARTRAARTAIDCALVLPFNSAVVITDQALHGLQTNLPQLRSLLKSLGRRKGVGQARRVLAAADPGAGSPAETLIRMIVTQAGFEVESQVSVYDKHGHFVGRVDLKLKDLPVVLEFDGRGKYQLNGDVEKAHWEEKIRNDRLQNAGFIVRRFRWEQLFRPDEVIGIVLDAIRIAKQSVSPRGPVS